MSIWSFLLKINGAESGATYGLYPQPMKDPFGTPPASFPTVSIPNKAGSSRTTSKVQIGPKTVTLLMELVGSSEQDYEDKADAVRGLWGADVAIIIGSQETRQRTGLITAIIVTPNQEGSIQTGIVELDVECDDPLAYETSATTVTGSSGADIATALGRWDSLPVVTVTSPTSPLVLTYKNHATATIATATISFAGSPTTVVVDMANQQITIDGVRTDTALSAGNFFALDPHDGTYASSQWPTLRISSGSLSAVYTKRYP